MRRYRMSWVLVACAASASAAAAQGRGRPGGPPGSEPVYVVNGVRVDQPQGLQGPQGPAPADPFARFLYPPELVMGHQQAIGLTDRQRTAISAAMLEAQKSFIDAQFDMSGQVEKLQSLLKGTSVDESAVLAQVDRVLAVERGLKHAQLGLMIKIKNTLTEQQQAALDKLRGPVPGPGE
jgi:Spy/CpxP family protein refolding chaperone